MKPAGRPVDSKCDVPESREEVSGHGMLNTLRARRIAVLHVRAEVARLVVA